MSEAELPSLAHLPTEEKARRAGSFGEVAGQYERFRPGPSADAVRWMLPAGAARVVDLGAGTGALTRLLVGAVSDVVAVEPDERMRAVLVAEVPGARAVEGRGESMPLPDGWADAVLASSSWHWVDPAAALPEVARVLRPGGVLGAVWSGPDAEGPFLTQAKALLASGAGGGGGDIGGLILGDVDRPLPSLEVHPSTPFEEPEHEIFRWARPLTADEIVGLLGTLSWVITMPTETRDRVLTEARRLLRELLGVEGDATVDVDFRADAWRARRVSG